ncbi:hypothetical protein ANCCAN_26243 [Ancylostoma caninum]|uniref:Uncharacterized protein n=1 Tax=Ancylostoma caninum TaxID=29170 RepID=A0A368FAK5_ANCCA|nr:hypothetical protein ANCCAN_26243 [Ancylostoma caninum]
MLPLLVVAIFTPVHYLFTYSFVLTVWSFSNDEGCPMGVVTEKVAGYLIIESAKERPSMQVLLTLERTNKTNTRRSPTPFPL